MEPILLVADYPYQQPKQSVYDFYSEYNEIRWMKRVFFNQQVDIHNDDYVTMFMSHCAHSSYLLSQSRRHREEYFRDVTLRRADPTHIYVHDRRFSFYTSAIPTTIQTYFNYPESPIDNTENKIVAPSKNMQRNYNQIHQLHYLNIPDYEIQDVVINLISKDDNMKPRCAICNEFHKFEDCKLLSKCPPICQSFIKNSALGIRNMNRELRKLHTDYVPRPKEVINELKQVEETSLTINDNNVVSDKQEHIESANTTESDF